MLNQMISQLWPLVAVYTYNWLIPLISTLIAVITIGGFWTQWAIKKDDPEFQQKGGKKKVIKNTIIVVAVLIVLVSILDGIAMGIIQNQILIPSIKAMQDNGSGNLPLTAEGGWKSVDYYLQNFTTADAGTQVWFITIRPRIDINDDGTNITNFAQIQQLFKSFIKPSL